jgi:hypothetical protein
MLSCTKLTSIDLSELSNVTTIGNNFMSNCSSLTNIDLSRLTQLTTIGYGFMSGCASLTNIDLSKLDRLQTIGKYFLEYCTNLITLDLSNLKNTVTINTIGEKFLFGCNNLKYITCSQSMFNRLKSILYLPTNIKYTISSYENVNKYCVNKEKKMLSQLKYKKSEDTEDTTKHPRIVVKLYSGTASLMSNHRPYNEDNYYLPDDKYLNIINEKYSKYNKDPTFFSKLSDISNWESLESIPNCMKYTYDGPWQYPLMFELEFKTKNSKRDAKEFIIAINQSENQKNSYGEWEICAILKGKDTYEKSSFISGNIKL